MNSELELKEFVGKQTEETMSGNKELVKDLKESLHKKKLENLALYEDNQDLKNNIIQLDQSLASLTNEKDSLEAENERLKVKINCLENDLNENRMVAELLEMREKEI